MKYLGRLCFILQILTCVGCSLDAALTQTSVLESLPDAVTPTLPNPPVVPPASNKFTSGIYIPSLAMGANGVETQILKQNSSGLFEKVYSPSFYSFRVIAIGDVLIAFGNDASANQLGIYRLDGETETKIAGHYMDPSYKAYYVYNDSLYVCMFDYSLIRIDPDGTVTTISTNAFFIPFGLILEDDWMYAISNSDYSLFAGPADNPIKHPLPGNWRSEGSLAVVNKTLYVGGNEHGTNAKALLKLENGIYEIIPTPSKVDSISSFNNEIYFTLIESGKVNLHKYAGTGTSYQFVAELGDDVFWDPQIHGVTTDGLYITKKNATSEYELFLYDGTFHKITSFADGLNYSAIQYSKVINNSLAYSHNGNFYLSNKTEHYPLTGSCLTSFAEWSILNNEIYIAGESQTGVCKLSNQILSDFGISYYFGSPTEIK